LLLNTRTIAVANGGHSSAFQVLSWHFRASASAASPFRSHVRTRQAFTHCQPAH
jgi:hypothetical protein